MARIEGVSKSQAGLVVKLVYRFGPRAMKKLTGRDPQTGNGIEPIEIWAYQPKMMIGMGRFNQAVRKGKTVDERTKNLVELKGAQMIGCEYCVDLGSQICRNSGLSDSELLALPRYQSSDLFTEREKAALDYTVAVMRTPVEVTDELFTRVRPYFDERQLVEITALLTLVNIDRFNAAFGIGSAGFSDGMVCVPPDRPDPEPSSARITGPAAKPDGTAIVSLPTGTGCADSTAVPTASTGGRPCDVASSGQPTRTAGLMIPGILMSNRTPRYAPPLPRRVDIDKSEESSADRAPAWHLQGAVDFSAPVPARTVHFSRR